MNKITQLPADVVAKISAGQVVVGPHSIVKELIENSLDAGATQIQVGLQDGGRSEIIVSDNGYGMSLEDINLSYLRYTTSKLSQVDDLLSLSSFGFRGEALYSITTVAHVTIESRTHTQDAGYTVVIKDGKVLQEKKVPLPKGTRIIVRDVFQSVSARKKFLKSKAFELRKCLDVVTATALAHPEVGFVFMHDGEHLLSLPTRQSLSDRIAQIFGHEYVVSAIPFTFEDDHFHVQGFLGKPQLAQKSKTKQHLFVNNRWVRDFTVAKKIREAFATLLEARMHPWFLLEITVDPALVDVNVDPQKKTIHFHHSLKLEKKLPECVRATLKHHDITFRKESSYYQKVLHEPLALQLKESVSPWQVRNNACEHDSHILQIQNSYLALVTKEGLVLIDQHAAHESVLYQQFKEEYQKKVKSKKEKGKKIKPVEVALSPQELIRFFESKEVLKKLGFVFEQKERAVTFTAAHPFFADRISAQLISDILSREVHEDVDTDILAWRTISYLACKAAIKAGESLTQDERRRLVDKLTEENYTYTCPHGRPVKVELGQSYLEKLFRRV